MFDNASQWLGKLRRHACPNLGFHLSLSVTLAAVIVDHKHLIKTEPSASPSCGRFMRRANSSLLAIDLLASAAMLLQGCSIGAYDDPFTVTIVNDTHQTVVDHAWFVGMPGTSNGGGPVVLKPGGSFGESEFANEGVDQDRITTLSRKTLDCLPFQFSENPPVAIRVMLTQMLPCQNWGNPPGNTKFDWPDRNY
jgi:hypothetical protein